MGVEKRFSESLLDFLNRYVAEAYEYQVRWKWSTNAVAIWDNRATFHTGIFDYCEYWLYNQTFGRQYTNSDTPLDPHLRHGLRVATQAEKPTKWIGILWWNERFTHRLNWWSKNSCSKCSIRRGYEVSEDVYQAIDVFSSIYLALNEIEYSHLPFSMPIDEQMSCRVE